MITGMEVDIPSVILVVDDIAANLRQLCEMLAMSGYRVMPAQDGATALKAAESFPPDLILLDIRMPGMDGFEVCCRLKANPALKDVPVIFISALGDIEDKLKAYDAGGVDYITKPFQHEEVLARVKTHLDLRRFRLTLQHCLALQTSQRLESLQKISDAVSHQLRNPITIISGFATLLLGEKRLKHPQREYLEGIKSAAARIEHIIQAVHEYASLRLKDRREMYLPELIERVRAKADKTAAVLAKTVDWTVDVEPLFFPVDDELVFQALCAVLTNSIEAFDQPRGAITLRIKKKNTALSIEVSDNGRGIPETELTWVLDPFFTTKAVGIGMGLTMASRIAQEHYGSLEIHSQPGLGTTVEITLGRMPMG
ncbi:ATP-binding response regulator [Desulfolutivibrio sulfoxidireducens]|uniref:ATP-binding response regulator n=1 Tax=Desulfolutivibrio sulfoxidireducens TaxID=2773299 RepID=UPI00159D688E|nr:hybrid sensor histidine kinase/response regulator [Desulfolutivibrio sulfoxidireducens]QLA16747.1 response regulator [Desulfolutivibrio sulfoxidireducens]QLA20312.1 response regulator [Desulfolutivibrio sulfoxidireducens]